LYNVDQPCHAMLSIGLYQCTHAVMLCIDVPLVSQTKHVTSVQFFVSLKSQ